MSISPEKPSVWSLGKAIEDGTVGDASRDLPGVVAELVASGEPIFTTTQLRDYGLNSNDVQHLRDFGMLVAAGRGCYRLSNIAQTVAERVCQADEVTSLWSDSLQELFSRYSLIPIQPSGWMVSRTKDADGWSTAKGCGDPYS